MGSAFQKMLLATLAVGFTLPFHTVGQEIATKSGGGAAVFVMTNSVEKNEVIVFNRVTDGSLQEAGHYSTGGRGSGGNTDPLESQGSLTLNADHSLLLAVNAGSGELSLFRVLGPRLVLADTVASGGSEPNAVAVIGNLVYVLNTGGSSNVVGFTIDHNKLRQIPDSTRFLTTNTSGAASVAFSPDGKFLVVTERLTNNLDVFAVQPDGSLAARVVTPSAGPGAFSVAFASNGTAIVSETGPANVANGSAVSSYHLLRNGTLSPVSNSLPTFGAANCWNVVTPDGRFVYVSNAGSASISGFAIAADGVLNPLPNTVVGINPAGATNLDIAISADGKFLYTLNSGSGTIGIFQIQDTGTLSPLGSAEGIEPVSGFNGIAAN